MLLVRHMNYILVVLLPFLQAWKVIRTHIRQDWG